MFRNLRNRNISFDKVVDEFGDFITHMTNIENEVTYEPQMNIKEDENEYVVELELCGLTKEDVKINIDAGKITISGEKKLNGEKESYYHIGRKYGKFKKVIGIDSVQIDINKVTAEMKDGILTVSLSKQEKMKPVEIKIN